MEKIYLIVHRSTPLVLQLLSILLVATICTSAQQDDPYFRRPERIVKASNDVGEKLGNYAFQYETEGGILQREIGKRKYEGTADETQLIQGSVQYNAPDGTPVAISWTADEYGAQVSGTHLPTPPPIPPEIQRALDWLAKQPSTTEEPSYGNDRQPAFSQPSFQQPAFQPQQQPLQNKSPIFLKKQQFNKPLPFKRQQQF
ncbi:hypothetical protein QAD02_009369 [Eretmocerus hayati]|uniref:Uncharacterized protein n=1 Tax=Eretmocerus hayati TaxID=131215 RepID=A0ACC2NAI6_9HYME|nr:hypothetical protein QAD02_009369 [Eretmocerus hayati]